MDIFRSMTVFVRSVELGSFSAAGDALNMSPQLVGKYVFALEKHLGVKLLNRTTRSQSLTDIGLNYYENAKRILSDLHQTESQVADNRQVPKGNLRISAPVLFGVHALTPVLPEYLSQNPEVSIELSLSNKYVDIVEDGFDIVFRTGDLADSTLIARALKKREMVLCASPSLIEKIGEIKNPKDLIKAPCIAFTPQTLKKPWVFYDVDGNKESILVSGPLTIDNGDALLLAARSGLGIILQAHKLVEDDLKNGSLIKLLPDHSIPEKPFYLVYQRDKHITPKLKSFIDFVILNFA